jgi:hypothetical protein
MSVVSFWSELRPHLVTDVLDNDGLSVTVLEHDRKKRKCGVCDDVMTITHS